MERIRNCLFVAGALMVFFVSTAGATTISYSAENVLGNRWEYSYLIVNNTLVETIAEFTVFFDFGSYANLGVGAPKNNWDELTVEPADILGLPQAGFYDALATLAGISPNATEGLFRVSFDWLGVGNPGAQSYEIVNPNSFEILDSGRTLGAAPVPEPGTMLLTSLGLVGVLLFRKKIATKV